MSNGIRHDRCPCCGGELRPLRVIYNAAARSVVWDGGATTLTPVQSVLFDLLWQARPTGALVTQHHLVTHAYQDRPDGGPLHPEDSLRAQIHYMRRLLAGSPIEISSGWGVGYRLIDRPKSEAA